MEENNYSQLLRKQLGELMDLNESLVGRIGQLKSYILRAGFEVPPIDAGIDAPIVESESLRTLRAPKRQRTHSSGAYLDVDPSQESIRWEVLENSIADSVKSIIKGIEKTKNEEPDNAGKVTSSVSNTTNNTGLATTSRWEDSRAGDESRLPSQILKEASRLETKQDLGEDRSRRRVSGPESSNTSIEPLSGRSSSFFRTEDTPNSTPDSTRLSHRTSKTLDSIDTVTKSPSRSFGANERNQEYSQDPESDYEMQYEQQSYDDYPEESRQQEPTNDQPEEDRFVQGDAYEEEEVAEEPRPSANDKSIAEITPPLEEIPPHGDAEEPQEHSQNVGQPNTTQEQRSPHALRHEPPQVQPEPVPEPEPEHKSELKQVSEFEPQLQHNPCHSLESNIESDLKRGHEQESEGEQHVEEEHASVVDEEPEQISPQRRSGDSNDNLDRAENPKPRRLLYGRYSEPAAPEPRIQPRAPRYSESNARDPMVTPIPSSILRAFDKIQAGQSPSGKSSSLSLLQPQASPASVTRPSGTGRFVPRMSENPATPQNRAVPEPQQESQQKSQQESPLRETSRRESQLEHQHESVRRESPTKETSARLSPHRDSSRREPSYRRESQVSQQEGSRHMSGPVGTSTPAPALRNRYSRDPTSRNSITADGSSVYMSAMSMIEPGPEENATPSRSVSFKLPSTHGNSSTETITPTQSRNPRLPRLPRPSQTPERVTGRTPDRSAGRHSERSMDQVADRSIEQRQEKPSQPEHRGTLPMRRRLNTRNVYEVDDSQASLPDMSEMRVDPGDISEVRGRPRSLGS